MVESFKVNFRGKVHWVSATSIVPGMDTDSMLRGKKMTYPMVQFDGKPEEQSFPKMSKLDRFFVSENLLTSCPNISAITLERFISDHRPILLRETSFDYGPIPFRFYKYWLEVDGFDKMVRESWEAAPGNKDNAIRSFMGKLKFLKDRIRVWLSIHKANSRSDTDILKEELRLCDELIDKGMGSSEVVLE
ncbi:RNA-directed DNA polymerase, eukaryota [Tanacetum coccineum]